jgi:hypothetical protein
MLVPVKIGPIGLANIGWKLYIVFIVMTFIQLPIGEQPVSFASSDDLVLTRA